MKTFLWSHSQKIFSKQSRECYQMTSTLIPFYLILGTGFTHRNRYLAEYRIQMPQYMFNLGQYVRKGNNRKSPLYLFLFRLTLHSDQRLFIISVSNPEKCFWYKSWREEAIRERLNKWKTFYEKDERNWWSYEKRSLLRCKYFTALPLKTYQKK